MKTIILEFVTDDFVCLVRADSEKIKDRQKSLRSVLNKRKKSSELPSTFIKLGSLQPIKEHTLFPKNTLSSQVPGIGLRFCEPIFFENTSYEIEVRFADTVSSCEPKHHLQRIQDSFAVNFKQSVKEQAWLRLNLDFRNDLGWFRLPFRYVKNGVAFGQSLSFEVWPFKMAMAQDLNAIYKVLDNAHPLLRFSWRAPTEQGFSRSRFRYEPFELLWLAEFKSLNEQMQRGYKQILNAPHNRLLPEVVHLRAERLKGKLPNKLAEKARLDIKAGRLNRRYALDQKRLNIDTPENQFIKQTLNTITKRLEQLKQKIKTFDENAKKSKEPSVFSDAFYEQLIALTFPYQKFKRFPLFKQVSDFKGLKSESLVLQQKSGYSSVYQAWHKLKYYLDVLGQDASVSIKNIADLYEIWCFLHLADILQKQFGFAVEGLNPLLVELSEQSLDYAFKSGENNKFLFSVGEADQKISIELKHEFSIGGKNKTPKIGSNAYVAWMAEHRPDIFMKVTFADGRKYVWLFDAKYRIDVDKKNRDWVPVNALAQMHRYRDAIIYQANDGQHSRPVYGAYALYPGYFANQESTKNPYQEAIDEIDIGAFPFLPGSDDKWLIEFLSQRLGLQPQVTTKTNHKVSEAEPDHVFKPKNELQSFNLNNLNNLNNLKSAQIMPTNFIPRGGW